MQKQINRKKKKIAKVDKIHEPLIPINRPKKVHEKKLKNGIVNMQKYIIKFSSIITYEVKKHNKWPQKKIIEPE